MAAQSAWHRARPDPARLIIVGSAGDPVDHAVTVLSVELLENFALDQPDHGQGDEADQEMGIDVAGVANKDRSPIQIAPGDAERIFDTGQAMVFVNNLPVTLCYPEYCAATGPFAACSEPPLV